MRFTATMKVPLAMPWPTITCCHSGWVSNVRVVGLRADGGGVDEDLGPGQGVGPAQLGEPLVPAGGEAEAGLADGHGREAAVATQEVAVLVVAGRDRDVHLPGPGHQRAVGSDHDGRVVPPAVGRRPTLGSRHLLVERGVDVDPVAGGQLGGQRPGGPAVQRLGLGPPRTGAAIGHREVRAEGQLLEGHQPCASSAASATPAARLARCSAASADHATWTAPTRSGARRRRPRPRRRLRHATPSHHLELHRHSTVTSTSPRPATPLGNWKPLRAGYRPHFDAQFGRGMGGQRARVSQNSVNTST